MNTSYQPRHPKASGVGSELLLAFLLMISFAQIGLCLQAGTEMFGAETPMLTDGAASTLQKKTLLPLGATALTNAQASGFHSAPARG